MSHSRDIAQEGVRQTSQARFHLIATRVLQNVLTTHLAYVQDTVPIAARLHVISRCIAARWSVHGGLIPVLPSAKRRHDDAHGQRVHKTPQPKVLVIPNWMEEYT